jgi:hypothetical protein
MHLNMSKGLPVLLFFLALLTPGCTSKWVVDKHMVETALQWPQPPNKPKIRQVMTMRGFQEEGTSLKTIFAGKGEGTISQPVSIRQIRHS